MHAYNRLHPDACVTHFTSRAVSNTGSAEAMLAEFIGQLHPEDRPDLQAYITVHHLTLENAKPGQDLPSYSSRRFRARNASGRWEWYQIRSSLYWHEGGLAIVEGVITELTEMMDLLLQDPLTGLANRLATEQWLQQQLEREPLRRLALINLDLDRFRAINDTFGMPSGDRALQETANLLRRLLPEEAWLARLEADEFLVALTEAADANEDLEALITRAETTVKRIQERLQLHVATRANLPVRLTLSAGVTASTGEATAARPLLQQANTALMEAKREGLAGCCRYSPAISAVIEQRMWVERQLDTAALDHALALRYQPQLNRRGELVGAEVLLRWDPPDGHRIGPDVFIPIAEQTGQIHALGHWVLEQSCRQLRHWIDAGLTPPRLAINISAVQLEPLEGQPPLPVLVRSLCRHYGLQPALLELEITETALVGNWRQALEQLQDLVDFGIELAIDDFGTGFASLKMLQCLPVHGLKIDRSFIHRLEGNPNDRRLVKGSLLIARELQLRTVAEGVETPEQHALLLELGCEVFQGYLFGVPLNGEGFTALLSQRRQPQA